MGFNLNEFRINRRTFLLTSLMSSLPFRLNANYDSNPDVVIVGAGAAGIAAAQSLHNKGLSTIILEASDHVGGRVYTDRTTFGFPYDVGAHWLHNGKLNPYQAIPKKLGFELYPARSEFLIFKEGRAATDSETIEFWSTYEKVYDAIDEAGEQGRDLAAAEVVKNIKGEWSATAKFVVGPWSMAKNMEDFSTLDWWHLSDGNDYFCVDGFGSIVAEYAKGLNVSLNTKVECIDWSDSKVTVISQNGSLSCSAVIVTVSTGVLASELIKFVPSLPLSKRESFDAISMGVYNHIALQFSEDVFGMGNDGYVLFQLSEDGNGFGTLTNASGSGLAYCDLGGNWAKELEQESIQFRVDYALTELKKLFGNKISRHFIKGTATSWGTDPLTLGSYASARPGAYNMRSVLREPVGDRIFFAGEACHRSLWASVGGAHESGVEVAKIVARKLTLSK